MRGEGVCDEVREKVVYRVIDATASKTKKTKCLDTKTQEQFMFFIKKLGTNFRAA